MPVGIALGVLYAGSIAAGWVIRSLGYGVAVQEANDVIKDITSGKPSQNPTSWSLQIMKEMNNNNPRGWGTQHYFY